MSSFFYFFYCGMFSLSFDEKIFSRKVKVFLLLLLLINCFFFFLSLFWVNCWFCDVKKILYMIINIYRFYSRYLYILYLCQQKKAIILLHFFSSVNSSRHWEPMASIQLQQLEFSARIFFLSFDSSVVLAVLSICCCCCCCFEILKFTLSLYIFTLLFLLY